jgi:hypothetical protein
MEHLASAALERTLQNLQSKVFSTRRAAAAEAADISLTPSAYPNIAPARLAEFEQAIKQAAAAAIDPKLLKQGISLKALAPGFVGLGICLLLPAVGVRSGAIVWAVATAWLLFWYFRTLAAAFKGQTAPVRQAVAIGQELGILKK